jgi:hypothetical protein
LAETDIAHREEDDIRIVEERLRGLVRWSIP